MCTNLIVISHIQYINDFAPNVPTLSEAKCRESWVVGRGRGSWVLVNVVGKKSISKNDKVK